ncbi:agmatine deiminase family protein [bacterium]|nr:agmatine deiminase family protein [bacterium]
MTARKKPIERGFRMPAEWEPQAAVWLAWSDLPELWPGNFAGVEETYARLLAELTATENVRLLVRGPLVEKRAADLVRQHGGNPSRIEFFDIPYDDCWMRDNGPIFLTNNAGERIIIDWGFNGWGGKYGPCDQDDLVPRRVADKLGLEWYEPKIILEGGSIETNGQGLLMTSAQCLLHPNRNGTQSRSDIEPTLRDYFGAQQVIWLNQGLCADHTDGHIDNIARFVAVDHVVAVLADDIHHPDHESTHENLEILKSARTTSGQPIRVTTIPLPKPIEIDGEGMSPSHANFILGNGVVIMPTYDLGTDDESLAILTKIFPDRRVIGLPSLEILRGGGSLHCISQQEPLV